MTRYYAWLSGVLGNLRKPLNKDEYRVLGMVTVLATLFGAAMGFIAVLRWEAALVFAIMSIPGGLFGGMLSILLLRRQRVAKMPSMLRMVSVLAIILVLIGVMVGLQHMIPSRLVRFIVITIAVVVITIARHVYGRMRGSTDSEKCGKP